MKKKMFSHALKTICIVLLFVMTASCLSVCGYAVSSGISEIVVAAGADGRTSLENNGYTVLFQSMNLVSDEDSTVVIGYKKGADAITDVIASSQKSDTVTYGGCTYQPVSDISLNYGTDAEPVYLYYTKDSSAGNIITSFDTVSGFSGTDEILSLRNDGSSPVRTVDGTLANMDSGIENCEIYLLMYRSADIKKYISDVCIVRGGSKTEAVNSAASRGCDYYLYNDFGGGSEAVYIAYKRTSDAGNAVTKLTVTDLEIYSEKDGRTGAYLMDISAGKLFGESFELGDWAGIYASYDKSLPKTSDAYKQLLSSTQTCSCVFAGSPGIYAVYEGNFPSDGLAEAESLDYAVSGNSSGDAMDEFYDIDKSEDTTSAQTDSQGGTTASVVNKGNIVAIVCFSIILILIIAGAVIYIKRRKLSKKITAGDGQNGKEND